jgi:riboflavin transporter FmnP
MNTNLIKILKMAMLCAISVIFVAIIRFPIFPQAPYLVYDPADIPLLVGAFLFGPGAGLLMTAVTAGIQALFFSADGIVGFFMHVLASGTLVAAAGFIYKIRKTRGTAVLGLLAGIVGMTGVMVPANLIITTNVYGTPYDVVVAALPFIIGFNLIKATVNSVLVFAIYKPLGRLLKWENNLQPRKI